MMHVRELDLGLGDPEPAAAPAIPTQTQTQTPRLVGAATSELPRQGTAVVRCGGPAWILHDGERDLQAERAASCLLEPEPGDRVWFVAEADSCFVIAVLARAQPAGPAQLSIDGDASLRIGGQLAVHAGAGLELRSDAQVGITGDELRVQARLGRVVFDECTAVLRTLFAHVTNSTFVATVIETLSDRLTQSTRTSFRSVAEIDQVQAGTIDYRAQDTAHIAADKTLINGGQIAKVEAGQIHLG